jgi:uncharacterized protein (TIGR02996 family)
MLLEAILNQLDASLDDTERLVGADWLEENGCLDEASFYRWLVAKQLEPFRPYIFYRWYHYINHYVLTIEHLQQKAIIQDPQIWRTLVGQEASRYGEPVLCYDSRTRALVELRSAYLNVCKLRATA